MYFSLINDINSENCSFDIPLYSTPSTVIVTVVSSISGSSTTIKSLFGVSSTAFGLFFFQKQRSLNFMFILYKTTMNQICIAKKISERGVEKLDFALDDKKDQLIVFDKFSDASKYLNDSVPEEELFDYLLTTVEAQKDNVHLKEALTNGVINYSAQLPEAVILETDENQIVDVEESEEPSDPMIQSEGYVEISFLMKCSNFAIPSEQVLFDANSAKGLFPAIVFVDPANPEGLPVTVNNFVLQATRVSQIDERDLEID